MTDPSDPSLSVRQPQFGVSHDDDIPGLPNRAVLIFVLGILGLAFCIVLAPVAWVMGRDDLRQIDLGHMSAENRGLVQAGKILGIVGTVNLLLQVFVILPIVFLISFSS